MAEGVRSQTIHIIYMENLTIQDVMDIQKIQNKDCHWSQKTGIWAIVAVLLILAAMWFVNRQDRTGEHWTVDEVEGATRGMTFPQGVNRWDKYVAMNAWYADLCRELNDEQLLKTGRLFWFYDEDWKTGQKLWWYFCR